MYHDNPAVIIIVVIIYILPKLTMKKTEKKLLYIRFNHFTTQNCSEYNVRIIFTA